jgi:PPM family protein phosphatase
MKIQIAAATHIGCVRETNQDAVAFSQCVLTDDDSGVVRDSFDVPPIPKVCVLADGLGGHGGGDEASKFAVEKIVDGEDKLTNQASVIDLIESVHKEICWQNRSGAGHRTMGTTVCGIALNIEKWIWFNVGDSRIYAFRDPELCQVSIDDVPSGERINRTSSRITQCLGGSDRQSSINVHVGEIDPREVSRILLASDGLTSFVRRNEIAEIICNHSIEQAVVNLVDLAISAGGADNISVAVIEPLELLSS